jgi:hypothetical protein
LVYDKGDTEAGYGGTHLNLSYLRGKDRRIVILSQPRQKLRSYLKKNPGMVTPNYWEGKGKRMSDVCCKNARL